MRFLLDTNVLIWYCNASKNIPESLRYSIEYYEHEYFVSVEALREIAIKGAIKGSGFLVEGGLKSVVEKIKTAKYNLKILPTTETHILTFEGLSKPLTEHNDPFDRLLIAQAISEKMILISSDNKFLAYKDKGFELFHIEHKY